MTVDAAGPFDPAALYAATRAELVGYLDRLLGDRAAAEDVAQDAGMRFVAAAQADRARNPRAFLFHIATNAARDTLRRRAVRERAMDTDATDTSPGADHVAISRQQLARVSAAVDMLPTRPREVLLLARVEGCSHKDIARRLGISPKTSENHLARAMAMLAAVLRQHGDDAGLGDLLP